MTKDELLARVAQESGLTKADAGKAVDALVDAVRDDVARGNKVQLPGLGTFESRERAAREGRNPQTGETMKIAATRVPGFKAATAFKQAVGK